MQVTQLVFTRVSLGRDKDKDSPRTRTLAILLVEARREIARRATWSLENAPRSAPNCRRRRRRLVGADATKRFLSTSSRRGANCAPNVHTLRHGVQPLKVWHETPAVIVEQLKALVFVRRHLPRPHLFRPVSRAKCAHFATQWTRRVESAPSARLG